ncbi:YybH family protein [Robertkochia aurantiaca]|uniref:YybH family protein n=1 Tax=Robertkochia aurantiaca TaxID=2873700 RepID=UPI001CCCE565|nr:DUF4440 domain-containing protein [Robertkochia sp. 3YJGBD-33]
MKKTLLLFVLLIPLSLLAQNSMGKKREAVYQAWSGLYQAYASENLEKMLTYYQDDVIRMGTNGTIQKGKELFRKNWKKTYAENKVIMNQYSEPTILPASDHITTYNTYDETFINKESGESERIQGTWIAIWKQQDDGSWKARMTTWHLHE